MTRLQAALAEHYRIDRELGRGGMAVVYLAHDLRHDRPVALKVLHPELAQTLGTDRFLREIKLAARLQHPHIVSVHDSGEVLAGSEGGGCLWFTMPYIEGESLRDRLRREHQLPIEESVRITREVALALDFAHRHGIIHRDIKPENILLLEGHALVADFGIGRALDAASTDDQITNTGFAVGTPAYMSPEQTMAQRDIDGRTDVYSLGVVLYEMLAGEPPFAGPTAQAIVAKRMTGEVPSLRRLRPSVPEQLERVVLTALAPIPADRFATPGRFAEALSTGTAVSQPVETTVAAASRRRPAIPAWLIFVVGLLVTATVGMLVWQRSRQETASAGTKMLAVLPFKNMGAAGDQYFADGLTEEITSRLAGVSELGVVSRTSADQYKGSSKTLRQIGQELGVGYVLEGSVRWEKSPNGSSRVRVTPQLIRVTDDRHLWADRYDAELADVFQVQSSIAEQVTSAMNLALDPTEKRTINERPTANTEAYDFYLRGLEYGNRGPEREDVRNSIEMFRRAVALDSNFAQAWAKLSSGRSSEYWFFYDRSEAALSEAKAAADRALRLRPDLAEPHVALGYYYYWGKLDYDRALQELALARERQPNNADLFMATAAVQRRQGRWPEAVANFEKAVQLDPRSTDAIGNLAETYILVHQYDLGTRASDRAISIGPDISYAHWMKIQALVGRNDLQQAKQALREALKSVDFLQIARLAGGVPAIASFAVMPDFLLVGDSTYQSKLEQLTPAEFVDTLGLYQLKANMYRIQGLAGLERAYLDSSRTLLESLVQAHPDDAGFHSWLGLVYARLGRKAEAVREGQAAVKLMPVDREAFRGANLLAALAMIYATVGMRSEAIAQLEYLLSIPSQITVGLLRHDPRWAPLRGDKRFEKLIGGE
ncbi:MAG TPA: protein kinase [Gemmatimonadales bacterium]|nr:protein kinase [Gemmatimonadales bacterium]